MAKQTGLSWTTLSVDDSGGVARDIRNDVTNFDFATPRASFDTTGVDKSAMERLLGLADFTINLTGVADFGATTTAHAVFSTVPSTSVPRTVSLGIGGKTLPNECLFTSYDFTRDASGSLTWKTTGVLADGTVPTWA